MNASSFASQVIGFVLTNGHFESSPITPRHDGFIFEDGDVYMKMWLPREGWFHLLVRVGSYEDGTRYCYSATNELVSETTFISFDESVSLSTPNDYGDYDLQQLEGRYFQTSNS